MKVIARSAPTLYLFGLLTLSALFLLSSDVKAASQTKAYQAEKSPIIMQLAKGQNYVPPQKRCAKG